MVKSLFVVLWEAHKCQGASIGYAAKLLTGQLLAGEEVQPAARVELVTRQYYEYGSVPLGFSVVLPYAHAKHVDVPQAGGADNAADAI